MYLQSKDANCRLQNIISLKYLNIKRGRLKTCVHRFYVVIHQLSLVVCNQRIGTGLNSLFSNHVHSSPVPVRQLSDSLSVTKITIPFPNI